MFEQAYKTFLSACAAQFRRHDDFVDRQRASTLLDFRHATCRLPDFDSSIFRKRCCRFQRCKIVCHFAISTFANVTAFVQ
jgi:hypothetical protein